MPHVCRKCDFFDSDGAHGPACPECGGDMRFTMLDPRATATATLDEPEEPTWKDPFVYGYEVIEAPWEFRYAQIGIGVSTYFFAWRWGQHFLHLLIAPAMGDVPEERALLVLGVAILAMNCLAAFVGGAAAGFWAKNWVVQGLGVAVGVLGIPIIGILIFLPESWPLFAIGLAVTSCLSMAGAFVGHLVVKPTRVVNS